MTDVVAALIWDGDRFLACQRPAHKARGLLWEFVGGKVEPGESKEEALIRECREELAVTVQPGSVFMELIHEYPDLTVRLTLFNARITEGKPQLLEHNDIRWITTKEIGQYDFCPADVEILRKLSQIENELQGELISHADPKYRDFQCALMPTVSRERVLGVRIPFLRKLAAKLRKEGDCKDFLSRLPHRFYEENCIHGILLCGMKDPFESLERFLPFVDNWAVCDLLSPKAFAAHPPALLPAVCRWLKSNHPYTVRFGIGVLMKYFLDDAFALEYLEWVASVESEEYYVKMMAAWYFATALAKQYASTVVLLEQRKLSPWVHNKTIQKAVESFRISVEVKEYLKTLKIK